MPVVPGMRIAIPVIASGLTIPIRVGQLSKAEVLVMACCVSYPLEAPQRCFFLSLFTRLGVGRLIDDVVDATASVPKKSLRLPSHTFTEWYFSWICHSWPPFGAFATLLSNFYYLPHSPSRYEEPTCPSKTLSSVV